MRLKQRLPGVIDKTRSRPDTRATNRGSEGHGVGFKTPPAPAAGQSVGVVTTGSGIGEAGSSVGFTS